MKPSLRHLQEWMRWAITDPRGIAMALPEPHPADLGPRYQAPTVSAQEALDARDHFDLVNRLSVYAEAYFHRLSNSLADDFPATVRFLGDDDFRRLINDYLKIHPSSSFTLADVGENLAAFVAETRAEEPWLEPLIKTEWLLIEAFYAPDSKALTPIELAEISEGQDWSKAQIVFGQGTAVFQADWPVLEFHRGLIDAPTFTEPVAEKQPLLVYRHFDGGPTLEKLDEAEGICLGELLQGRVLESALSLAAEIAPLSESSVSSWFARWQERRLIQKILFPAPVPEAAFGETNV